MEISVFTLLCHPGFLNATVYVLLCIAALTKYIINSFKLIQSINMQDISVVALYHETSI